MTEDTDWFELFDVTKFPFDELTCSVILKRREQLNGQLFFDIILESTNLNNFKELYPPNDTSAFQRLFEAYSATMDSLRKNCITYYLLKWWNEPKANKFRYKKPIPPHFVASTDAYFNFDKGDAQVRQLVAFNNIYEYLAVDGYQASLGRTNTSQQLLQGSIRTETT